MSISEFMYEQRGNFYIIGLLLLALILVQPVLAFSGSGAGTVGDPYQITTTAQWNEMNSAKSSYYKLMNDLDFSGVTMSGFDGWFTGGFDGDFKVVKNVILPYVDDADYAAIGLFTRVATEADFKNLYVQNATKSMSSDNSGSDLCAGIIFGARQSQIAGAVKNFHVDSTSGITITGGSDNVFIGSIAGRDRAEDGQYTDCGSLATLSVASAGTNNVGGIVGKSGNYLDYTRCYYGGTMTTSAGTSTRGGIQGSGQWEGTRVKCYSDSTKNSYTTGGETQSGDEKTTTEMRTQGTYSSWTFDSTHWKMSGVGKFDQYPVWFSWTEPVFTPVADFTVDNTQVDVGLPVAFTGTPFHFTDLSTNTPTSWNWSFGDGSYSTVKNATHAYSTVGTYDVSLNATNSAGSDVETKTFYVNVVPNISGMSFTPSTTVALSTGASQTFDAVYTGSKFAQLWDFGDGYTSDVSPTSVTHQYNTAGTYDVSYGLRDGQNTWHYVNKTGLMVISGVVTPNFTFTPSTGTAPLSVAFTDTSSGGTFLSATWNFGDGSTSTTRNVSHTFATAGTKSVSLLWENTAHDTGYIVKTIAITSATPPVANFSGTPLTGDAPKSVTFTDSSTNTPTSWMWSFGDGSTSTLQNPSHTYTAGGNYTVVLTATNPGGSSSVSKNNYVQLTNPISATPNGTYVEPTAYVCLGCSAPYISVVNKTANTTSMHTPLRPDFAWLGDTVDVYSNTTGITTWDGYNIDSWRMAYYREKPLQTGVYSSPALYTVASDGTDSLLGLVVDTPEIMADGINQLTYNTTTYKVRLFAINASYVASPGDYDYGNSYMLVDSVDFPVEYTPTMQVWTWTGKGTRNPYPGETITLTYNYESFKGFYAQPDKGIYIEASIDGGASWFDVVPALATTGDGSMSFTTTRAEIIRSRIYVSNGILNTIESSPEYITIEDTATAPSFTWKNSAGTTITSASDTDRVFFGLDTGTTSWQNKMPYATLDLYFQKYNKNTGVWQTLPTTVSGYTSDIGGDSDNSHTWGLFRVRGSGNFYANTLGASISSTEPKEGQYRAVLMANGATGTALVTSSTLTIGKNLVNPVNAADAAGGFLGLGATGGFGTILFGSIITIALAIGAFLLVRDARVFLVGAMLGIGVSFALGLFPLWMMILTGIVGVAVLLFASGILGGGGESGGSSSGGE